MGHMTNECSCGFGGFHDDGNERCELYSPDLVEVDAHGNTSLCDLDLYYCESLVWMDLLGCIYLEAIYAYGCALPQAAVDQVLADLVANGTANGYLQLNGPGNAPPSNPGGIALKNILISRGWTVYTN